ncbi:hypothetical protein E1287_07455 [Actinomadura sp. KC06]|uniref:hypothetical protein n=1 Tax=Actinomadura sp. KC06 TaxID=2530369 RepID=UPI00104D95A9|nr:hypothetical protein [Actinomadura sp. KC06]TDD37884.1 hypothetical protein E1287_07455 [Actinomadura sp. KC06]
MDRLTLNEASPATTLAPRGTGTGRYRALLIREGWGSSGYYPREVLERDGPKCWPAGTQQYLNHPTQTEQIELPERKVQDWASVIVTDPVWDEAERGLVAEVEVFPQWQGLLNKKFVERVGLSIRALGVAEHGEVDGREGPIVKSLTEGISVDWVTQAGAGGRVLELIESARGQADESAQIARLWEAKYDAGQLKAMLAKGQAMKNDEGEPSYPIADEQDLRNAIRAVGRGGADHDKLRAHITRRAKALGKIDLLPADWASAKAPTAAKESAEPPTRDELREAGATIGGRLEARIHTAWTVMADDLYCDGRLTREERITLSSAFGDALGTFVGRVEKDAPQLYQRGPWSFPSDENGEEAPVSEADAKKKPPFPPFTKKSDDDPKDSGDDAGRDVPDDEDDEDDEDDPKAAKKAKTAPGSKPAPKKMKEGAMPEISDEQLKVLNEAADTKTRLDEAIGKLDQATQLIETQGKQIGTLETRLAEADKRDRARDNSERARTLCSEALATSGLPTQAHPRVLREATVSLPIGDAGVLDETRFDEAVKAAIQGEKTYLAELDEARGYGFPRGLTSDPTPSGESDGDLDKALAESLEDIGMNADEAKIAAAGR